MDRLALLAGSQSKPDLVQFGASRVDFAEKRVSFRWHKLRLSSSKASILT